MSFDYREKVSQLKWFHAIDFDQFQSSGRFPQPKIQNQTLLSVMELLQNIDVSGLTCLDIGTADGLIAFGLKLQGAKKVCAIDPFRKPSFELAREILNIDVEYYPGTVVHNMDEVFSETQFDLIICAGVIYHMFNPMRAILSSRKLLKQGGIFILESAAALDSDEPIMRLNSESSKPMQEVFTYWMPTPAAMTGMMKLASFDILGTRVTENLPRFCAIGKAVQPEEVRNKTEALDKMHRLGISDPEFNLGRGFDLASQPQVKIDCRIQEYHKHLPLNLEINFPPHPKKMSNPLGQTAWMTKEGNW